MTKNTYVNRKISSDNEYFTDKECPQFVYKDTTWLKVNEYSSTSIMASTYIYILFHTINS